MQGSKSRLWMYSRQSQCDDDDNLCLLSSLRKQGTTVAWNECFQRLSTQERSERSYERVFYCNNFYCEFGQMQLLSAFIWRECGSILPSVPVQGLKMERICRAVGVVWWAWCVCERIIYICVASTSLCQQRLASTFHTVGVLLIPLWNLNWHTFWVRL
jgi:hypothetical protein